MNVRYVRVGTGVARVTTLTCSKCGREWEREGSDGRPKTCDSCRNLARARATEYTIGGGVSAQPNRLTAATVAHLLTPGDSGRAASGSKTDA